MCTSDLLRGQPIYRIYDFDGNGSNSSGDWRAPAVNDPYELDLSRNAARSIASNAPVDNAFSAGELERVLRPYDIDAATLPQRIRQLVPMLVPGAVANSRDRRYEVTTEQWDLPSPNVAVTPGLRTSSLLNGDQAAHISELLDRKSTRLNSSHIPLPRMPSSA